ncbi:hypothetical protein [Halococcus saccharolyticus]|nr:hypothetical protein [Halococcus saccharolyticus]
MEKPIEAVTDETLVTYSDNYILAQFHTITATILEGTVDDLLAQ